MTMPMKRSNASTRKQQVLNTGIRGMRCSGDIVVLGPGLEESKSIRRARNLTEHKQRCSNTLVDSFGYSQNTRKMMHSSNNHLIGSLSGVDMDSCSTNVTSFPLPLYAKKFGMLPFPRMPAKVLMLLRHMKLQWFNH